MVNICYDKVALSDKIHNVLVEWRLEIVAFVTGFVILAFELTAARVVAPYLGSTIYVWTSIIGVILAALAVGYIIGGVLADKRKKLSDLVVFLLAAALVIASLALIKDWAVRVISELPFPLQLQAFFASLLLFALPTVLLGMVMPYLARLNITDLNTSGRKLSRIDAAGTVGSLAGTFMTGYFLFGLVGSRQLLTILALALVAVSFLLGAKKYYVGGVVVALVVMMSFFVSSRPLLSGYISESDTRYSRVIVRDIDYLGHQVKVLQTDGQSLQSGVYSSGSKELVFDYTQAFASTSELKPNAKNVLIIGGGAFTFPEYIAKKQPTAQIDTVEIDSKLTAISRQSFDFDQPANLSVINKDGRQYLNQTNKPYDMIFLDAFNSIVPPFQLLTEQAVQRMRGNLLNNGVVVANFIARPPMSGSSSLIEAAYSTFKTEFRYVNVYKVSPWLPSNATQNLLLVASNTDLSSELKNIASNQPQFAGVLDEHIQITATSNKLTDDYAPIERLVL